MVAAQLRTDDQTAEALLNDKCSLCHTSKRIHHMDPAKIKETVARNAWRGSIESMLREKIGAELATNDQRTIDLLIYLKTH